MIRIDGAAGEGGGQILRTALSLSLATGKPFRIDNIRENRKNPGLLRQHLTAVLAAASIGSGRVEGATLRSTTLTFTPGAVNPGEYHFAVGTAGSGTLVFQTILPALLRAGAPSRIVIEGGTHNPFAPPFDFLDRTFLPLLRKMGANVTLGFERFGFYPAGGGRFTATIEPCAALKPLELGVRGEVSDRRVTAIVANLPDRIAYREAEKVGEFLSLTENARIVATRGSLSPGNIVLVEVESPEVTEMFCAFGERGVPAEDVAEKAAIQARDYLASRAVAGEHLTDQLLLPMALAGGGTYTASMLSNHTLTNCDVIRAFLDIRIEMENAVDHHVVRISRP